MGKNSEECHVVLNRILNRAHEFGLDQKTFAARIGVSPSTISDWKKGKSQSFLRTEFLEIAAKELNTTVPRLLYGIQGKKEATSPVEDEIARLRAEPHMEEIYEAALELSPPARKIILDQIRALKGLESGSKK